MSSTDVPTVEMYIRHHDANAATQQVPEIVANHKFIADCFRELIAAREKIKARDAEIARLNDRIEAYSIDLAVKEGKVTLEDVRDMITTNADDVAKSLERNSFYRRLKMEGL